MAPAAPHAEPQAAVAVPRSGICRGSPFLPAGPAAARAGWHGRAVRERSAAGSARAVHCGQGQPPPPFCLCQARRGRSGRGGRAGVWRGGFGPQLTMISAAQLLDELMGRDRNLAPDEKRSNVRWDHESVSTAGPPLSSLLRCSRTLRGAGGLSERHGRLLSAGGSRGEGGRGKGGDAGQSGGSAWFVGVRVGPSALGPAWQPGAGRARPCAGTAPSLHRGGRSRRSRAAGGTAPVFGCWRGKAVPAGAAVNGNRNFQRFGGGGDLPQGNTKIRRGGGAVKGIQHF